MNEPRYYILDEKGAPVPESDVLKWAKWMESISRRIAVDDIEGVKISTVFLGLDHNFLPSGSPILWETMVFGGDLDMEQDRCTGSREQAEAMHAKMVARVKRKAGK